MDDTVHIMAMHQKDPVNKQHPTVEKVGHDEYREEIAKLNQHTQRLDSLLILQTEQISNLSIQNKALWRLYEQIQIIPPMGTDLQKKAKTVKISVGVSKLENPTI